MMHLHSSREVLLFGNRKATSITNKTACQCRLLGPTYHIEYPPRGQLGGSLSRSEGVWWATWTSAEVVIYVQQGCANLSYKLGQGRICSVVRANRLGLTSLLARASENSAIKVIHHNVMHRDAHFVVWRGFYWCIMCNSCWALTQHSKVNVNRLHLEPTAFS